MDFFDRLKQLAKANGITLRNLIEEAGINYDSFNSAKRYGNLPRADEAIKLAKRLNTTVEYLVTGETDQDLNDQIEKIRDDIMQSAIRLNALLRK